ncbi:MAG TPA: sigma 54-interacting transcriptional regulator [Polyangiaceae bacterium]|nr:sigma 54-interacting transcriptional regulator [Polyangiaceae bacterium]
MSRRLASEEQAHPYLFVVLERARPVAGGARHLLVNVDRVSVGRGATRIARRVVDDGKRTLFLAFPEAGRRGPFVSVRCRAVREADGEELFVGTARAGAGALGFVREANGGTLHLDDVGALPPSAQNALLHVLREREVTPLGAARGERVDVIFAAAARPPVPALLASGALRVDLHAQLVHATCALQPLRERLEDVGLLLAAILPRVAGHRAPALSRGASSARRLLENAWPTNVHGLAAQLEAGVAQASGDRIELGG